MIRKNRDTLTRFFKKPTYRIAAVGLMLLVVAGAAPIVARAASCSSISECSNNISDLNSKNAKAQASINNLQVEASSYQDAINKLQKQIDSMQNLIDANVRKQSDLKQKIADYQKQIDEQKDVLGEDIRAMYVDGPMSNIEMLASSNSLSTYVDKQEYRNTVSDKIQSSLNEISALQNQLQDKKDQVDHMLSVQKSQQAQLDSDRAQQRELLSYNQSQQNAYTQKVQKNNQQIEANQADLNRLIAEQRQANNLRAASYYFIRVPGQIKHDPANGTYEYANWPFSMSTAPGCNDGDGPDRWGYCTRQCVSYAAWAVAYSGRQAPSYWGNAKDWVSNAPASWIHYTPEPGDVAISTAGTWGHAMYVDSVSGNQFYSLEYNGYLNGEPSNQWRTWR